MKKGKIRNKLIRILFLTSVIPLLIIAAITINFIAQISISDAYKRVDKELFSARHILDEIKGNLRYIVRDQNRVASISLEDYELDELEQHLNKLTKEERLDFFTITDAEGKVMMCISNTKLCGEDMSENIFVRRALQGEVIISTEILSERELQQAGLLKKAEIQLIDDSSSGGVNSAAILKRGMVFKAVLPIIDREENIIGTMSAGYLLNRNNQITDTIYDVTGLPSTIFIDDIRIASTVSTPDNRMVLGTRAEENVIRQVLEKGQAYSGRAKALDTWYITAYEPIYDINNEIIGMLGIGISEKEVFALRDRLLVIFVIAVIFTILLAMKLGFSGSRKIVKSFEELRRGTEEISKGNFSHYINIKSGDELEELADFFNRMTLQLKSDKEQLEEYATDLELKVKDRTISLEAMHKQLVSYEKMAAMGRMASALSHELRNVLAGIKTSAYYLKGKIGKDNERLLNSIQDIEKEIDYASAILADVLSFTRERNMNLSDSDINMIIKEALLSLSLQEIFKDIDIIQDLDLQLPRIKADGIQLRGVVSNLVINAAQAMPEGGKLSVITSCSDNQIRLEVIDTGKGMSKETVGMLFTPFFTTKSRGLGLGLCISREIVVSHGGKIEFETELNKGTKFIVILPIKAEAGKS
ncbi:MAG: cache domain-containing protein [Candidatus Omnitrophota bacterium]